MKLDRLFGGLVMGSLLCIRPVTATAASHIELADAIKTFLLPASSPGNILNWTAGATADSPPSIVWKTKGLATDPHGVVMRHASAVIAIDGKVEERLETRVVPVSWSVDLYGAMGGANIVDFNMNMLVRHEAPDIGRYLRRHGFKTTLIDCRGTGYVYHESLYRIAAPKYQPALFYENLSCGAVACMYRYELGFSGVNAITDFRDAEPLARQPKDQCSPAS